MDSNTSMSFQLKEGLGNPIAGKSGVKQLNDTYLEGCLTASTAAHFNKRSTLYEIKSVAVFIQNSETLLQQQ